MPLAVDLQGGGPELTQQARQSAKASAFDDGNRAAAYADPATQEFTTGPTGRLHRDRQARPDGGTPRQDPGAEASRPPSHPSSSEQPARSQSRMTAPGSAATRMVALGSSGCLSYEGGRCA
jgi:hypothetical protein